MSRDLEAIPQSDAIAVFTGGAEKIDPYLAAIRAEIEAFKGDATTAKGREEIKSMAFKVTKTKTALEAVGKRLADEVKLIPKKLDAGRKHVRDTLDGWAEEVRKPVTEWEAQEASRIAVHIGAIERMQATSLAVNEQGEPIDVETLRLRLSAVQAVKVGPECEEFEDQYRTVQGFALRDLMGHIATREKYESDQAELVRLRAEAAERARQEEAQEAQRQLAEQEAARRKVEDDRREAAVNAEREAAAAREIQLHADKEAAERRAAEAVEDERRRVARAEEDAAAEARRREDNKKHRASINRAAVAALVAGGLSEGAATAAVTLIAQKKVPAVIITY